MSITRCSTSWSRLTASVQLLAQLLMRNTQEVRSVYVHEQLTLYYVKKIWKPSFVCLLVMSHWGEMNRTWIGCRRPITIGPIVKPCFQAFVQLDLKLGLHTCKPSILPLVSPTSGVMLFWLLFYVLKYSSQFSLIQGLRYAICHNIFIFWTIFPNLLFSQACVMLFVIIFLFSELFFLIFSVPRLALCYLPWYLYFPNYFSQSSLFPGLRYAICHNIFIFELFF